MIEKHPFCRTGSFEGSRYLIHKIFQWYKILSPQIDLTVNSVGTQQCLLPIYCLTEKCFRSL